MRSGRRWGLLFGFVLDLALRDPRRGHPVAVFGRAAVRLERSLAPGTPGSAARGVVYVAICAGGAAAAGYVTERLTRSSPAANALVTAAATWAALGGASLAAEAAAMADALDAGDLAGARRRLPNLCGRDPAELGPEEIARATTESVAENTSDAVVAPLLWGAALGPAGLAAYRAINTLDAMVGHRSPRHLRFGWAAARLDDLVNWLPARATGLLALLCAPIAGGSVAEGLRVLLRDGHRHPSPNAGRCEAAFAGALGVRLGGPNVYGGRVDHRPELGDGRPPGAADIRRAVRLARAVNLAAAGIAVAVAGVPPRTNGGPPTN